MKLISNYDASMPSEEDIIRLILSYKARKQAQYEAASSRRRQGEDDVVYYLKSDDPKQYVVNGLLLCELMAKELIKRATPSAEVDKAKFIKLLGMLRKRQLLEDSELPAYKQLNALRNRVAHNLGYQVKTQDALAIWNELNETQLAQFAKIYGLDHVIAQDYPKRLVQAMILRLYTHLVGILEREELRAEVQALFKRSQASSEMNSSEQ